MKLNVSDEHKKHMANLSIEAQVLNNLLQQRKAMLEEVGRNILTTNGCSPKLYALSFSAAKDEWEAILKPNALTVPTPGTDLNKIKKN